MSASTPTDGPDRYEGRVAKLVRDFGFIHSAAAPGKDIYFHTSWFRGTPPLSEGEDVTFELRIFEGREQAHYVRRVGSPKPASTAPETAETEVRPVSGRLFDWAYLGHIPNALNALAELALPERWEFKDTGPEPDRPKPILYSYLIHTFGRLVLEEKVRVSESGNFGAFNTGLVDRRYEPIYALFRRQDDPRAPWQLIDFCTAGEGDQWAKPRAVLQSSPCPAPLLRRAR